MRFVLKFKKKTGNDERTLNHLTLQRSPFTLAVLDSERRNLFWVATEPEALVLVRLLTQSKTATISCPGFPKSPFYSFHKKT